MIDPVTGNVLPNGMQDIRALGMTTQANPFLSGVPAGAQSLGAPMATQVAAAPGPAVPATMPGLPNDRAMAAATGMPAGGPMGGGAPGLQGRIPPGILQALLSLSQRNPAMFDRRMASPMAQRFGITPEMVQNFQPAQPMGMAPRPDKGGFGPQVMPNRDAQFAAQSQIGMADPTAGKAKNQNIGSVPAY